MKNIVLSAFADEYSPDIDRQLEMLAENGIRYIEPRHLLGKNISELTEAEVKDGAARMKNAGIGVSSLGSPLGKVSLKADFCAHLEMAKRLMETANVMGTQRIRMFSFYLPAGTTRADCRGEVLDRLGQLLELAESYGITLCHENEAKIYGESPEDCLELLSAFGGKLRQVFDMGNFVLGQYKPYPEAYGLLKDYISYFHIKDSLYRGAIVPPGLGEASVAEILRDFAANTEKPCFATLEPHLETFDGLNRLTEQSFENPYKFESKEQAFLEAVRRMQAILTEE